MESSETLPRWEFAKLPLGPAAPQHAGTRVTSSSVSTETPGSVRKQRGATDPASSLRSSQRAVNPDPAAPKRTCCPVHQPTSQAGGSSQAAPDIHRRHRIPDPILVCRVVQTLHGAEAGAAVVAANNVDPVVKGHRGHIASLPSDALGFGGEEVPLPL